MSSPMISATNVLQDAAALRAPIEFEAVRDALSASYCLLFAERTVDRQVEAPVVDGVDPAYGDRLQTAAAHRLLPAWLRDLKEGIVVDRAALARDHDFARSEFYNVVIRPEGRFHCLIATPHVTPTRRYHLIVGRPARHEDFTSVERLMLQAMLPHVARLIASANDAEAAARQSRGLIAAFDCLSDNIVIAHDTGEVEFANAGARRLMDLGDGLSLAGPRLRGCNEAATAALRGAIARVTAANGPDELSVALPRPSGSPPYRVSVRRVGSAPFGTETGGHRALLLIQQPERGLQVDGRALAREYGLTERELATAILLAEGGTLRDAATTLRVSYQTARSHLRSAFSKLDVHRQSDLVRKVLQASFRPQ